MMYLKAVRTGLHMSQHEMAKILNCTQAYISQIENTGTPLTREFEEILKREYGEAKIEKLYSSIILKSIRWKEASDPDNGPLKEQFLSLLNQIQQKTNYSIEDVSQKIYRRRKEISKALYRREISPNMVQFILNNVKKLGIKPSDINLSDIANPPKSNLKPYYESADAFLKSKEANSYFPFEIFEDTEAFIKVDTNDLNPYISLGDIVGIKEVEVSKISPGLYYLISFTNEKYSFDFIRIGIENENSWALCTNKENSLYREISNSLIKHIFSITHTIRKE